MVSGLTRACVFYMYFRHRGFRMEFIPEVQAEHCRVLYQTLVWTAVTGRSYDRRVVYHQVVLHRVPQVFRRSRNSLNLTRTGLGHIVHLTGNERRL